MVLLLAIWGGCASSPELEPAPAEDLFFQKIISVPGYARDDLFEGAKAWVKSFSNSLDLIQFSNRPQGIIMAKTAIPHERYSNFKGTEQFELRFTLIVEAKDGKIRVTFKNWGLVNIFGYQTIVIGDTETIKTRMDATVQALEKSFTVIKEDKNW